MWYVSRVRVRSGSTAPAERAPSSAAPTTARTTEPPPASSPDAPGLRRAQAKVIGQVNTRPDEQAAIDRTLGKTLRRALGGQTLAANAANAKHLERMERSTAVVAHIERLPGRLDSIATFKLREAFRLYEHCFPNADEREPVADIKARVKRFAEAPPADGADFSVHVFTDAERAVVGYSQGSVVPSDAGVFYYWQYGCVADQAYMREHYGKDTNPRQQGLLNTIHGVNAATLAAAEAATGQRALGLVWEAEPRGLGGDAASIAFTDTRLAVHTRAGGRVMLGRTDDGELVNLHLQPRLTASSEPIALHMMFRPLKYEEGEENERATLAKPDAEALMMAWIDNFRREGFAETDVAEAEAEIRARFARCSEIVLLPANEVPDAITLAETDPILKRQLLAMYGVDDLDAARRVFDAALRA
jgi:hypothetical protein